MKQPQFYDPPNLFTKDYEHRHVRREVLARYIYEHWSKLMLDAGKGNEIYVWDSWPWDKELFIEAVSVWVGELVVDPIIDNMKNEANRLRGLGR
jgi:hypothetical protein